MMRRALVFNPCEMVEEESQKLTPPRAPLSQTAPPLAAHQLARPSIRQRFRR